MTRVLLLTGNERRHRYLARALRARLELVGVVYETKRPVVAEPSKLPPADLEVVDRHLGERDAVERRLLGESLDLADAPGLTVAAGEGNSPAVYEWVLTQRPEFLVLYGSSIIRPPLLSTFADRTINLHLGLSPYYRGAGTNFWPLVNREPECVGATIHLAVSKVDAGPILTQVRPHAEAGDRAHELGTKTIIAAAEVLPGVLRAFAARALLPVTQDLRGGRLYRGRDFTADAVRTMWKNFDTGMLEEYLADRAARNARFPLREWAAA